MNLSADPLWAHVLVIISRFGGIRIHPRMSGRASFPKLGKSRCEGGRMDGRTERLLPQCETGGGGSAESGIKHTSCHRSNCSENVD